MTCNNYSLQSSDNIDDLLKELLNRKFIQTLVQAIQVHIIREDLSPYLTEVLIDDLLKCGLPFSLPFNKMSTIQVKKPTWISH